MTEIVTNSIKYAFPDGRRGTISVELRLVDGIVTLIIADNGIGCDFEDETPGERQGIGRKLIRGFARQLNAQLFRNGENGTIYRFVFPLISE